MLLSGCVWDPSLSQTWCTELAVPQHGLLDACDSVDSCTRQALRDFLPPSDSLFLLPAASQQSLNELAIAMGQLYYHAHAFSKDLSTIQSNCSKPNDQWQALQSSQASLLLLVLDVDQATRAMVSFIQSEHADLNHHQIDQLPSSPLFSYYQALQSNRTSLLQAQPAFTSSFASRLRTFQSRFAFTLSDLNQPLSSSQTILDITQSSFEPITNEFPFLSLLAPELQNALSFARSTSNAKRVAAWLQTHPPSTILSLFSDFAAPAASVASSFSQLVHQSIQSRKDHHQFIQQAESTLTQDLQFLQQRLDQAPAEIPPYFREQLTQMDPENAVFLSDYPLLLTKSQAFLSNDQNVLRLKTKSQFLSGTLSSNQYFSWLHHESSLLRDLLSDWNRQEWWVQYQIPAWCQTKLDQDISPIEPSSTLFLHQLQLNYWKEVFTKTNQLWACEKALRIQTELQSTAFNQTREAILSKTRLTACRVELQKWWDHYPSLFEPTLDTNQLYALLYNEPSLAQLHACENQTATLQTAYLHSPLFLEIDPLFTQGILYQNWSTFLKREKMNPNDPYLSSFTSLYATWQLAHDDPFEHPLSFDLNHSFSRSSKLPLLDSLTDFNQSLDQVLKESNSLLDPHRPEWVTRIKQLLEFPNAPLLLSLSHYLSQADLSELSRVGYLPPYSASQISAWKSQSQKIVSNTLAKRITTLLSSNPPSSPLLFAQSYASLLPELASSESSAKSLQQEWQAAFQLLATDANRFLESARQSDTRFNAPAQQFTQKAATSLDQNRFLESIQYSHYAMAALAEPGLSNFSIPLALIPLGLLGAVVYYWQRQKKKSNPRALEEWKESE